MIASTRPCATVPNCCFNYGRIVSVRKAGLNAEPVSRRWDLGFEGVISVTFSVAWYADNQHASTSISSTKRQRIGHDWSSRCGVGGVLADLITGKVRFISRGTQVKNPRSLGVVRVQSADIGLRRVVEPKQLTMKGKNTADAIVGSRTPTKCQDV